MMHRRHRFLLTTWLQWMLVWIICSTAAYSQENFSSHALFDGPIHEPAPFLFDQEHIRLALRFEPEAGRVFGVAKLRIRPLTDTLSTLRLAAKNLDVYGVQVGVIDSLKLEAPYADSSDGILEIRLDSLQVRGAPFELQITYRATPPAGMYFKKVNAADTSYQIHIWTDGTQEGGKYWIPLIDNPADRLTSEIIATVPPTLDVLSNGRIIEEMETEDGMSLFHYLQDQPHPPGDIGLFIGRFQKTEQTVRLENGYAFPVQLWLSGQEPGDIRASFREVPDMLSFFSEKLDFTYPWPAYVQLIFGDRYVPDMSYTGFTVHNDRIMVDERAALDQPNTLTLATAIARQWFGHLISVDHWSDIWLTESLSRFMALIYIKSTSGDAAYYSQLFTIANDYFEEAGKYQRPLVWNRWTDPRYLLDQHAQSKGVWFFHTLFETLGEARFWQFLQSFTREQAFRATNTDHLLAALNNDGSSTFDALFDDWVYSAGHPEIDLNYQYDLVSESLYVSVEQTQEGYLVPPVFHLDLPMETYTLSGPVRQQLSIAERDQLLSIAMPVQPRYVLLDPDNAFLKATHVEQSASAWVSQLRYASHPLSQLDAIRQLRDYTGDPALFIGLQSAMRSHPIPEVRTGIIELISLLPPSDATERLLLETYESDESPLVRRAILRGLERFEDHTALIRLATEAAQSAQSYLLQSQAVASLLRIGAPEAYDIFQSALITPSYRDIIRQTALRSIDYTSLSTRDRVDIALDYSRRRYAIEVRLASMEILADLALLKNNQSKSALIDLLDDEDPLIRSAAVGYLGQAGSADEFEILQKMRAGEHHPEVLSALAEAAHRLSSRINTMESGQ